MANKQMSGQCHNLQLDMEVVLNRSDVVAIVSLTRELAKELREIEGETPSSQDADKHIAQCIAKIESHIL
jgi:hypothetical protein